MIENSLFVARLRKSVLVFLVLLLTGCSAFGFFFDRLAWLSSWQFNRIFKLEQAQEQLVRDGTDNMAHWMREQGFPKLIIELKKAKELWDQEQYWATISLMDQLFDDTSHRFLQALIPEILPVLLTLDQKNIENFRKFNQRHLREWYEYTDSNDVKLEFRIHQLSRWFGDLNDAQVQLVSMSVMLLPREQEVRIENNQVWTERLLFASLSRDEQAMRKWLTDPSTWWTKDFSAQREVNRAQLLNTAKRIVETMTPRQRDHFGRRLDKWIKVLNSVLSGQR
jgi:hypothetical protein